jgi:DNA-binding beta-propeller fold protein YncE
MIAAAATYAALTAATSSAAAVQGFGPLSAGGCLVTRGTTPEDVGQYHCAAGKGLVGANAVAVSPDGANVYVVGGTAGNTPASSYGNLAILRRDQTTGAISATGCLSSDGTDGRDGETGACTPTPSLLGADGVAVSPDGLTVYVTSKSSASVVAFARDPATGLLSRLGCMQGSPRPGSPCRSANVFVSSSGVVVSADNTALYVSAPQEGAISEFTLPPSSAPAGTGPSGPPPTVASIFTPAPTYLANPCVAVNGLDGPCAVGTAMGGVGDLALSPDGKQLYATAGPSKAVDVFSASAGETLAESGCLMVEAPPGLCANSKLMNTPTSAANSPDGRNVYLSDSSHGDGMIVVLARNASTGQLSDSSCEDFLPKPRQEEPGESEEEKEERQKEGEEKEPPDVCQRVPGLEGVSVVAVSGDGSSVYAFGNRSAVIFSRDAATGKLTETSCAAVEDSRCASLPSLSDVQAAAPSPEGHEVYVLGTGTAAGLTYATGAAVTSARAAATHAGSARVRVVCPAALRRPCTGRVQLMRRLASARPHGGHRARATRIEIGGSSGFTIRPGRQAIVSVRLSQGAERLLRSKHHLRLTAVVRAAARGGGSGYGRRLILTLARF